VRGCANIIKGSSYSRNLSVSGVKAYKKPLELGVRSLIR
jgi:hypothetical protein